MAERTFAARAVRRRELYTAGIAKVKKLAEETISNRKLARERRKLPIKQRLFELLGNKCVRCGFDDPRALQVDHVKGRPVGDNPHARGRNLYYLIVSGKLPIKNFQLLCANHNWIKRVENGEIGRYRTYTPDPDDWPKKNLWPE